MAKQGGHRSFANYVSKVKEHHIRAGENWGEKYAPSQIMKGSAAELTDEEIQAVSSYIQGLHLAN